MTIALDIETERLAIAIATKAGKSVATVLREALEVRALSVGLPIPPARANTGDERFRRSLAIVERSAARSVLDERSPEEIIGYDSSGLPG